LLPASSIPGHAGAPQPFPQNTGEGAQSVTEDQENARENNGEAIGMIARAPPTRRKVRDEWGTPG